MEGLAFGFHHQGTTQFHGHRLVESGSPVTDQTLKSKDFFGDRPSTCFGMSHEMWELAGETRRYSVPPSVISESQGSRSRSRHRSGHPIGIDGPMGRNGALSSASGIMGSAAEDLHAWSIFRQNLNSDFTDSALGSSEKSPLPYGNFQLRESTMTSILSNPRYGPKSELGNNMFTYLKFGLPRVFPPMGNGRTSGVPGREASSGYDSSDDGSPDIPGSRRRHLRSKSDPDFRRDIIPSRTGGGEDSTDSQRRAAHGGSRAGWRARERRLKSSSEANLLNTDAYYHPRDIRSGRNSGFGLNMRSEGGHYETGIPMLNEKVFPKDPFFNGDFDSSLVKEPYLQVRGLTYERREGHLNRTILDSISFDCRGGELLSFMCTNEREGTAVLDVIANRFARFGHKLKVDIIVNGCRVRPDRLEPRVAYVTQDRNFNPDMTVQQTLRLHSLLKSPGQPARGLNTKARISALTDDLGLPQVTNTRVQDLTHSEKLRLNVACHLLTDTDILLLDQPTKGMDIFDTFFMIEYLRQWANRGRIVLMAMNPPTYEIFTMVSRVVLISNGQLMFCGRRREMLPYFAYIEYPCPAYKNPADYYLDLVTLDDLSVEAMSESRQRIQQLSDTFRSRQEPLPDPGPPSLLPGRCKKANPLKQILVLWLRALFLTFPYNLISFAKRIILASVLSVVLGAVWWNLRRVPQEQEHVNDRMGFHWAVIGLCPWPLLLLFISDAWRYKGSIVKETRDRLYSRVSLAISRIVSTMEDYSKKSRKSTLAVMKEVSADLGCQCSLPEEGERAVQCPESGFSTRDKVVFKEKRESGLQSLDCPTAEGSRQRRQKLRSDSCNAKHWRLEQRSPSSKKSRQTETEACLAVDKGTLTSKSLMMAGAPGPSKSCWKDELLFERRRTSEEKALFPEDKNSVVLEWGKPVGVRRSMDSEGFVVFDNFNRSTFGSETGPPPPPQKMNYTLEEAVNHIGFGTLQVKLTIIAGLSWVADATEIMILSILAPALQCVWHISHIQQALLTTTVFVGMGISSIFWGTLSDMYGRKRALILSSVILCHYGVLSSLAPTYVWFLVLRAIVGVAIGCIPQAVTLYSEFLPTRHRAQNLTMLQSFWSIGAVFEVILAMFIMPVLGWRWLLALSVMPCVCFTLLCAFIPESPRYYLASGQLEQAHEILKRLSRENGVPLPPGVLIDSSDKSKKDRPRGLIFHLFIAELRWTTIPLMFIWFAATFCYYGIVLLSTEMLRSGARPCQVGPKCESDMDVCGASCNPLTVDDYQELLFTSLAEFPGLFFTLFFVDTWGRRNTMALEFFLYSGFMCIQYGCFTNSIVLTITLFAARGLISAGFQTIYVYTPEVYPTTLRAVGVGACSAMGKIGAVVTPFVAQVLMQTNFYLSVAVYTGVGISAGIMALFLPVETVGKEMVENYSMAESKKDKTVPASEFLPKRPTVQELVRSSSLPQFQMGLDSKQFQSTNTRHSMAVSQSNLLGIGAGADFKELVEDQQQLDAKLPRTNSSMEFHEKFLFDRQKSSHGSSSFSSVKETSNVQTDECRWWGIHRRVTSFFLGDAKLFPRQMKGNELDVRSAPPTDSHNNSRLIQRVDAKINLIREDGASKILQLHSTRTCSQNSITTMKREDSWYIPPAEARRHLQGPETNLEKEPKRAGQQTKHFGREYTVEDAVNNIGFGRLQIKMTLITGLSWMADAAEVMMLSILAPALHCAWRIPRWKQALMTTVIFAGMGIGAMVWGSLADIYGRKRIVLLSSMLMVCYGILSAASPTYVWFVYLRGWVGFAIGASPQAVTLYAEFLPTDNRATHLTLLQSFFSLGTVFEVILAMLIMPTFGWRWLLIVSVIPAVVFAFVSPMLPESPRYYIASRRHTQAQEVLVQLSQENKRSLPVGRLKGVEEVAHTDAENRGAFSRLFSSEMRFTTFLLSFIWFAGTFCYYGLVLLTTELLKGGAMPCAEQTVKSMQNQQVCGASCTVLTTEDYDELLFTAFAEFPGMFLAMVFVDAWGRRRTMAINFLAYSIVLLTLLGCFSSRFAVTVALFVARGAIGAAFQTVYVYTPEVYPTSIRSVGIGTCNALGRFGSILTPFVAQVLLDTNFTLCMAIYIGVALIASMAAIMLPVETSGMVLTDTAKQFGKLEKDQKEAAALQKSSFTFKPGISNPFVNLQNSRTEPSKTKQGKEVTPDGLSRSVSLVTDTVTTEPSVTEGTSSVAGGGPFRDASYEPLVRYSSGENHWGEMREDEIFDEHSLCRNTSSGGFSALRRQIRFSSTESSVEASSEVKEQHDSSTRLSRRQIARAWSWKKIPDQLSSWFVERRKSSKGSSSKFRKNLKQTFTSRMPAGECYSSGQSRSLLIDIPSALIILVAYVTPAYFMAGLQARTGMALFYEYLTFTLLYLMSLRALGLVSAHLFASRYKALIVSAVVYLLLSLPTSYTVHPSDLSPVTSWLKGISPADIAMTQNLIAEFPDYLDFKCSRSGLQRTQIITLKKCGIRDGTWALNFLNVSAPPNPAEQSERPVFEWVSLTVLICFWAALEVLSSICLIFKDQTPMLSRSRIRKSNTL
ncbi:unnamed protein product [Cyprideis torosa]|uniref:Uncharacterized protein n=1 Tax=Cyprideis torosa TaxID=163714 RepID=A0A7R8W4E1_9CRUS|nr:unnamed protein product [Cyprideis torosa]CAG0884113.1 unnamed protein product [Cyprideis torosa]